ncbi:MAG: hypothetical protein ACP5GU_02510 [Thermoprotei archaeon]
MVWLGSRRIWNKIILNTRGLLFMRVIECSGAYTSIVLLVLRLMLT